MMTMQYLGAMLVFATLYKLWCDPDYKQKTTLVCCLAWRLICFICYRIYMWTNEKVYRLQLWYKCRGLPDSEMEPPQPTPLGKSKFLK